MSQFDDIRNGANDTFEEYPLRAHDEWNWPIHETPGGSASLVESTSHHLKINAKLVGIILCGHHISSIEHQSCHERIAAKMESDGWRCFIIARGDGQYARNFFFVEETCQDTAKTYKDLTDTIGAGKVKIYKVKNRRNAIHWVSDASMAVAMQGLAFAAMGSLYRAFNYTRQNEK